MCGALVEDYPALAPVATEAREMVVAIDSRGTVLRQAEDEQTVAKAVEDVKKLVVIKKYSDLRLLLTIHEKDRVPDFLPDAPSSLKKLGPKNLTDRVQKSLDNLRVLPADHPVRVEYEPVLTENLAAFKTADLAEDRERAEVATLNLGLSVYKSELSQVRDVQLGTIQTVLGDRTQAVEFTIPWRDTSSKKSKKRAAERRDGEETTEEAPTAAPITEETPE